MVVFCENRKVLMVVVNRALRWSPNGKFSLIYRVNHPCFKYLYYPHFIFLDQYLFNVLVLLFLALSLRSTGKDNF